MVARFDGGTITSDAGGLLLHRTEQKTGILRQFARCFLDYRNLERIDHSVPELALGYEDLNDHDRLRGDRCWRCCRARPMSRAASGAGKSTLNRLELTPPEADEKSRYKKIVLDTAAVDDTLVNLYIQRQPRQPRQIVLDLDAISPLFSPRGEAKCVRGPPLLRWACSPCATYNCRRRGAFARETAYTHRICEARMQSLLAARDTRPASLCATIPVS